jgi:hypothetical protein
MNDLISVLSSALVGWLAGLAIGLIVEIAILIWLWRKE